MMKKDPKKRIGSKNKKEIKDDPFFQQLDWSKVMNKEYEPPEDFVTREEDIEVNKPYSTIKESHRPLGFARNRSENTEFRTMKHQKKTRT